MRLPLILALPFLIINALIDWYICRAVSRRCRHGRRFWKPFALWSSVLLAAGFILIICWPKKGAGDTGLEWLMWMLYIYSSIYLSKIIFIIFDLIGKIPQLWHKKRIPGSSAAAGVLSTATFIMMLWGIFNARNIDIRQIEYRHPALPEAFDGMTIAQISDLHVGTYGSDTTFVSALVDSVNALRPDVIVFTGDIVNRHTSEIEPFTTVLSRLNAPQGVYSVLGNHDYGDYYHWASQADKDANQQMLNSTERAMGWQLLNNENRTLRAGGDSIVIIGVENIGDFPFPRYGDLDKAYDGDLENPVFKILLSHNPAHWTEDIAQSPDKNIALTLAGHTHAMQFALGLVSTAPLRYKTWGGMYTDPDGAHDLYVNIGAGEVAIPARIGATPEVTLFTLRKGEKTPGHARVYQPTDE